MRNDLLPKTPNTKLARIIEECGETLKAIGKFQRFGAIAKDPLTLIEYDNVLDLDNELKDLQDAIKRYRRISIAKKYYPDRHG